jgi:hypothetical protein
MRLKSPETSTSDIMGLTDARERERLATRSRLGRARGWPAHGSIGRWLVYGLLAILVGGWVITALTWLL